MKHAADEGIAALPEWLGERSRKIKYEFDDWLLRRSGAPVMQHSVKHIAQRGDRFILDDTYECAYLIGAGGTGCPVYRHLFREANPRAKLLQVVALEHELSCEWTDGDCHLWFFEKGLPGYSWYVPKKDGYLNLGVGAIADYDLGSVPAYSLPPGLQQRAMEYLLLRRGAAWAASRP